MKSKLNKLINCVALTLIISSLIGVSVPIQAAETKFNDNKVYVEYSLDKIGKSNNSSNVTINNEQYPLFKVFDNPNSALQNIKNTIPDLLNSLAIKYNLESLSNDNWKIYEENLYDYANYLSDGESNSEFILLRKFFDIYENNDKNTHIMEYVKNEGLANKSGDNDEDLATMLPYTNPISQNFNDNIMSTNTVNTMSLSNVESTSISSLATTSTTFNKSAGVSYAESHATSPNSYNYMYFPNGDCTNFTSQILESGGVSQVYTGSVTSGWWHTCNIYQGMSSNHQNSHSWSVADTFCKYMGVGYSTTSISSFSHNIASGDFIAADFESDGDWNHVGFVTTVNSSTTTVGGLSFYDFKVAQHTTNYYEWTSSTKNGWDLIGTNGGTYARIIR
ncbi:MAG: amidase domain-containing protein [Mobilitalea sp.]